MLTKTKKVIKSNENLFRVARRVKYFTGSIKYKYYPEKASEKILKNLVQREVDLKNPKTLTEKIMYINLYNQHELAHKLADKYAVRDYIKEKGYGHILVDLLGVYDNAEEIDFHKLPNKFVLKCNHGSGYNIICKDKNKLDIEKARKKLNRWVKEIYSYYSIEKHYSRIKPKIVCEKYMNELANESLHFINGKHVFSQCYIEDDVVGEKSAIYDTNWNKLDYTDREEDRCAKACKPIYHDEMMKIAADLSKPFKYIRIDFYDTDEGLKLSELTFTPMGCGITEGFKKEIDEKLGALVNHIK